MNDKEALLNELDQARARMQAVVQQVNRQRSIYPSWTIKEVLAHIAGWDDAAAASLRAHAGGREPATPAVRGIDHYNAESVATRESLSLEHVLHEWHLAREQLKAAVQAMPPEKLAQPMLLPWGGTGTVAQIVRIFSSHEIEHAEEIAHLLEAA